MGIPYRVTVSDRLIEAGQYELTRRNSGEMALLTRDELLDTLN
jgi:prolyl-tRNA synthetase